MAKLGPSVDNLLYGKGSLYFRANGAQGFDHLGNAPAFGMTVETEKTEHYSSMAGAKEKDLSFVNQKSATASATLEEFTAANLARAFLARDVSSSTQAAGSFDAVPVSVIPDLFTDLGKVNLFATKVTITGESADFEIGEVVTGGTSAATGKIAWCESGLLELVNVSGSFEPGESLSGGSSASTATLTDVEQTEDVVVTDAAAATTRYTQGTDYDINVVGGLFRVLSSGSIEDDACHLSSDYEVTDKEIVDALTGTEVQGELLFVGNPAQGPKWKIEGWKVNLSVSSEVNFIGDDASTIPLSMEYLSDRANHPSCPFYRATRIG
jgi:hypothetical protein